MYATCLFCNGSLGANTRVACFPVGNRLAYDAATGRLWVVCRRCERWNLTPLDERWDAIETCERLAHNAPRRVRTNEIELVTIDDTLDVVRIGAPSREEFAAWRYGDQFGRRRKRWLWRSAQAAVGVGALAVGGLAIGGGALLLYAGAEFTFWGRVASRRNDVVAHVPGLPRESSALRRQDVERARVWGEQGELHLRFRWDDEEHTFSGASATRLLGAMLPHVNRAGATSAEVRAAVHAIDATRDPDTFVRTFDGRERGMRPEPPPGIVSAPYLAVDPAERVRPLGMLERTQRLALEMALHEAAERRAMEGELQQLAAAWREAAEIAAIADDLLVPDDVTARLHALKHR